MQTINTVLHSDGQNDVTVRYFSQNHGVSVTNALVLFFLYIYSYFYDGMTVQQHYTVHNSILYFKITAAVGLYLTKVLLYTMYTDEASGEWMIPCNYGKLALLSS